jgi:hypothetical protein
MQWILGSQIGNVGWNANLLITATAEGAGGRAYMMGIDTSIKPPKLMGSGQSPWAKTSTIRCSILFLCH